MAVCAIGVVRLAEIADRLQAGDAMISRALITQMMVDVAGEEAGGELAKLVFGMSAGYRADPNEPETRLHDLRAALAAANASGELVKAWDPVEPQLARLVASKSVRLATKALDVSYDFERLYLEGRILTSIRPIFDQEREEIQGAAIVQTLRLDYMTLSGRPTSISVAMDRGDIEKLQKSCAEALRKGDAAYKKAVSGWGMPTILSGDEQP